MAIRAILPAIVALSLCGCATNTRKPEQAARWQQTRTDVALRLAGEHAAAGRFERARRALADFRDSADPGVQLTLAGIDLEQGRYGAALERLARLPDDGPGGEADHLRAVALEGLGRWREASDAYEAAYRRTPQANLLTGWLDTLVAQGKAATARQILERERRQFPGDVQVHRFAARLFARLGDHEAAAQELHTAALAGPEELTVWTRLAESLEDAAHHTSAAEVWRMLIANSTEPDEQTRFRRRLAACLLADGAFAEARQAYRDLTRTGVAEVADFVGLATACLAAGEPAAALESASDAVQRAPRDVEARLVAALSCRRLDRVEQAREHLAAIPPTRRDARVRRLLASCQAE